MEIDEISALYRIANEHLADNQELRAVLEQRVMKLVRG